METENLEEWSLEDWTEEGFQEGEVLETVLSEVMAFVELSGTVQTSNYHPIIVTVLPNRSNEMKDIENEIIRIEMELEKFPKVSKKQTVVSTVPPNYEVTKSSRRSRPGKSMKARRGVEPVGENNWNSKLNMKRMFEKKKLSWRAVPPPSTATPPRPAEDRLLGRALPQPSTATLSKPGYKSYWVELPRNHPRLRHIDLKKKHYWE